MNEVNHHHESAPAEFLVENIGLLPRGLALDTAMGSGRNAVYLAKMGFQVEGLDISQEAIDDALRSAKESGVTIKARVADLEKDFHISQESYDVIICFNYLQHSLVPAIKGGLRRGGMVVYETFIIDQAQFGKPKNPDYLLRHNELLEMFREFRCLRSARGSSPDPGQLPASLPRKSKA
ncbi:MAG: class I SAM-dependent methyltransferase [Chloroflexota bacterium]